MSRRRAGGVHRGAQHPAPTFSILLTEHRPWVESGVGKATGRARSALYLSAAPRNSIAIDFEWVPHGHANADVQTIRFGPTPRAPGLYRIDLDLTHIYIGEARDLASRFSGYRNPGGSVETIVPRTNRRVQRKIVEALEAGRMVPVQLCTAATITVARETNPLPLDDKTRRLLVGAAAIILAEREGFTLENLRRR